MPSFHYALWYRYKCRGGAGTGLAEVVSAAPLANFREAKSVLDQHPTVVRAKRKEPFIREPWPQVTRIIPTDRDGRPLNKKDIQA